jgi:hypothetical protein
MCVIVLTDNPLVCASLLPPGGIVSIFGNDTTDLIVSGKSQKAVGLGYNGVDPPAITSDGGIIHSANVLFTNGPDATFRDIQNGNTVSADKVNPQAVNKNFQAVVNLLNSPIGSGAFGQLLP